MYETNDSAMTATLYDEGWNDKELVSMDLLVDLVLLLSREEKPPAKDFDMVVVLLMGDSKTDAITYNSNKTSWDPKLFG